MQITQTADYSLIAQLNKDVQELHHLLYPEYFKPYHYESICGFFQGLMAEQGGKHQFYVVQHEDNALGYVWLELKVYPDVPFRNPHTSVFVHQLSVGKNSQHQGIGSLLMKQAEEIAEQHNIRTIELDYWVHNENARLFYAKHGYQPRREFVYKLITGL